MVRLQYCGRICSLDGRKSIHFSDWTTVASSQGFFVVGYNFGGKVPVLEGKSVGDFGEGGALFRLL